MKPVDNETGSIDPVRSFMIKENKTIIEENKIFSRAVSRGKLIEHSFSGVSVFKIKPECEFSKDDDKEIAKHRKWILRINRLGKKRLAACIAIGIFAFCIEITTIWNLSAESIMDYRAKSGSYRMLNKTAPDALIYAGDQAKTASIAYIEKKEAREEQQRKEEEIKKKAAKSIIHPG